MPKRRTEKQKTADNNRAAAFRAANPQYFKEWRMAHPEYKRQNRYGVLPEIFKAKRKQQNNRCAICDKEFTKTPCVDHDHACCNGDKTCGNCVRGLLCLTGNILLAVFENLEWCEKAENYLNKWKPKES